MAQFNVGDMVEFADAPQLSGLPKESALLFGQRATVVAVRDGGSILELDNPGLQQVISSKYKDMYFRNFRLRKVE